MAIFQALFAALGRQVGRLINTIFSWATPKREGGRSRGASAAVRSSRRGG